MPAERPRPPLPVRSVDRASRPRCSRNPACGHCIGSARACTSCERSDRVHSLPLAGQPALERDLRREPGRNRNAPGIKFANRGGGQPRPVVARRKARRLRSLRKCVLDLDGRRRRNAATSARRYVPSGPPPPTCSDDSNPSFAPDGRQIVFVHSGGQIEHQSTSDWVASSEIVWRDVRGGKLTVLRRLTGFRGDYETPQVSPDGTKLVFRVENWDRARPKNGQALFVVNLDGTNQAADHALGPARSESDVGARRSPDPLRVNRAGGAPAGTNLYTVRPDGTDLRRLTNVGTGHYVLAGSYSPDGKAIVYATDLGATPNLWAATRSPTSSPRRSQAAPSRTPPAPRTSTPGHPGEAAPTDAVIGSAQRVVSAARYSWLETESLTRTGWPGVSKGAV